MATTPTDSDTSTGESRADTDSDQQRPRGPERRPAVRIMLPGRKSRTNRLEQFLPLADVIEHATQPTNQLDYLEFLGMPGGDDKQYEHYLVGHDTSQSTAAATQAAAAATDDEQLTFSDSGSGSELTGNGDNDSDEATSTTGAITNALREYCPDVDYQTGTLSLAPIADIPVPTSRLLVHDGQTIDSLQGAEHLGCIKLIQELIDKRIPHVYQLLIKRAGSNSDSEYIATVRVAVFDEEYGIATSTDQRTHLDTTSSYQYRVSKYFRDELCTDNFELPIQEVTQLHANSDSKRYRINGRPIYLRNKPFPLEELATFREYNNLIAGSFNADPRYERHFNCYAHMPVNGEGVNHLAGILPTYHDYPLWDHTATTDGPTFTTTNIPSDATTAQRLGNTTVSDDHPTDTNDSTSKSHRALVNYIVDYLVQQGYTILAVDQDTIDADLTDPNPTTKSHFPGDSQPDIVAKKNGDITVFEAEINDSNPASYLKNLERAVHFDYPVVVVTQESSDLDAKLKQASRPFNTTDDTTHGNRLYNYSKHPIETPETTYLLPRSCSTTKWYLTHNDILKLIVEDTTVASGHPEDNLHALEYKTPRYHTENGEYIVTSASGEHLGTYATEAALLAEFTVIKRPFIPTQLTYLDRVEFRYQTESTNQLKRYRKNPDWARRHRDKPGKRHKAARNEFIETHTTAAEDYTLFIPDIRKQFYPWFNHQTTLDPPTESWFPRGLDQAFSMSDTDSRDRELLNRTWVYTPGLNPHYPDFPNP